MSSTPLLLFDHDNMRCVECALTDNSRFGHTFGGNANDYGIRFTNLERTCHLLFRLNLADPLIPRGFPKATWLPLCYPFSYATYEGEFAYQLITDQEIEFVYPKTLEYNPDFPYQSYPSSFESSAIEFTARPYDLTRAEDALEMAGVFGLGHLTAEEMAKAIKQEESLLQEWRGGSLHDWSDEELMGVACKEPFSQSGPIGKCPNPSCAADTPRVLALYEPRNDVVGYLQIVFQHCDSCGCIKVSNQCD